MYLLDLYQKTHPSLIAPKHPSVLAIRAKKILVRHGGKSKINLFNNASRRGNFTISDSFFSLRPHRHTIDFRKRCSIVLENQ